MNVASRMHILSHPVTAAAVAMLAVASVVAYGASHRTAHMPGSMCSTENKAELLAKNEILGRTAGTSAIVGRGFVVASNPRGIAAVTATYIVRNIQFDADHNPSTQTDVVHINPGESVLFQWESGIHTTENGNANDPDNGGDLWLAPIDVNHKQFTVTLSTPGSYPFFCGVHGGLMTGTIIVDAATPTRRTTWGALKSQYR
jgi:plastocyanin